MKYITYENQAGMEDIRLFSIMEEHVKVSREMTLINSPVFYGAGFVKFNEDGSAECYGKSTSMHLKSRGKEDTAILQRSITMSRRRHG